VFVVGGQIRQLPLRMAAERTATLERRNHAQMRFLVIDRLVVMPVGNQPHAVARGCFH
jgi:hypothetical protein